MPRYLCFASVLLFACALAPSTSAQCPGPDGLSGACWQPSTAALPAFPDQALSATSICWDSCVPTQNCARVVLAEPVFVACGEYTQSISVDDCTTGVVLSGTLALDYTRTWEESTGGPAPIRYQVYRFAVKVHLAAPAGAVESCYVPLCAIGNEAYYYGYLDYALDCTTGAWESALMLFHNCDEYIHKTAPAGAFSPAGAFHPKTMYAIVAPSSAANPFVASPPLPAPGGAFTAEAVRNAPMFVAGRPCIKEDRVSGSANFIIDACLCPISTAILQVSARNIKGSGTCTAAGIAPTTFKTLKTPGAFPWFHAHSTWIGTWTTGATYPGPEQVWADEAPVVYQDSCYEAAGLHRKWGEQYYGASTGRGFTVLTPGLSDKFIDWASNASFPLPGTPAFPIIGPIFPTRNLIYLNVP